MTTTTGDLRSLLDPETFSSIPSNTAAVLQQAWSSHTDTLRSNLEKVRIDAEQRLKELTTINDLLNMKLAVYSRETEKEQITEQPYIKEVRLG